jgi:methyl-accepting chemotaxis protein
VEEQAAATREITGSVQQVTAATAAAADSLRHVSSIAEVTDASSTAASEASEEVGRTAETLRSEVTEFLAAMSHGDEAGRRRYERIPADGTRATLMIAGRPGVQATIQDISRGGMQVLHHCDDKIGTDAEITLPGGGSVHGRIARSANGLLGFAFRQDQGSLDRIDQTLAFIRTNRGDLQAGVRRTDQMYDAKAG